ncbi:MAG: hypothetical protein ACI81P_003441 [Neolewinella sp.]
MRKKEVKKQGAKVSGLWLVVYSFASLVPYFAPAAAP